MKRPDRLIIRVTPLAPGFTPNEPQEYAAKMVEPGLTVSTGRGLSVGQAIDNLIRSIQWTVIVDVATEGPT